MPDPLGRACIFPGIGQQAITAVDIFVWRPSPGGPSARWLMPFVNSADVRNRIAAQAGGTTRQRIAGGRVKQLVIAIPPLPEQRRIVAKIDSLSGKSRRARDHLDHIPRLVEKYKQAILEAAFRGELTRRSRETHREPFPWSSIAAGKIIEDIVAGKNLRCEERQPVDHERGVVKVSAVTWGKFDSLAVKTLPPSFIPPKQTQIKVGVASQHPGTGRGRGDREADTTESVS